MTGYPAWLDAYLDWEHRSRGQIHNYLDAFFSTARYPITPYAVIALAWNPYLDGGKVRWRHRKEMSFAWPAERAQLIDTIMAAAPYADVGVCPYLMKDRHRRKGNSLTRHSAHADIDAGFDARMEERVRDLPGGCAINSGQPGHAHVYTILSRHGREVLDLPNHEHLCRVVGEWFHATDPKISDNDMMRMPGCWNFKPRAYDQNAAPLPVSWVVGPPEDRPDPIRLRRYLGTRKVGPGYSGTSGGAHGSGPGSIAETEPVDLTWRLGVKAALKQRTPAADPYKDTDRSVDTHRIVGACVDAGLTLPQTRWVINRREDLRERIEARYDDDVGKSFAKITADRDEKHREEAMDGDGQAGQQGAAEQPTGTQNGSRFFVPSGGFLALDLANAVMASVTCGFGFPDQRFYTYDNGVWQLGEDHIRAEITRLLGNRYRSAHTRTVLDLIQHSPSTAHITDNPLAEYINVPNGMVAWKTGDLLPHSPDHRSTVQLPIAYDQHAKCPLFEKFIAEVLPPDLYKPTGDSLGFIWELIGYTLYSGNPLHVAVLLYGKGRNGKGTLIRVLKALLGTRNCSTVGLHQLVENRFRAATLFGRLANLAGDLDSKWLDNTATFKAITGGDAIQAEHKYGAAFDFSPWALPFYSTNKAFGSADSSEGWVARWVVVPFPTSFMGREDRTLDAKLQTDAELRGILRRGIEALPALMARGRFIEPESLWEAKAAFVVASDAVRAWLDEHGALDLKAWTPRPELYDAYRFQAFNDGSKVLSAREFYNRMEQINGVHLAVRRGERGFAGVRLVPRGAAQGAGAQAENVQAGA